ncbi:MAG: thermonuclease family protein [Defluviitaleaceae bacterium]|nr:thermonuclease family protein [Defluviitaleaceae bacterium]
MYALFSFSLFLSLVAMLVFVAVALKDTIQKKPKKKIRRNLLISLGVFIFSIQGLSLTYIPSEYEYAATDTSSTSYASSASTVEVLAYSAGLGDTYVSAGYENTDSALLLAELDLTDEEQPNLISETSETQETQNTLPAVLITGLEQAVVERVIDGDTIVLVGGERVRFIGIDAPEIGEPGADEATLFVRQLIDGQTIWMSGSGNDRDAFGRLRRYIWLVPPTDLADPVQIEELKLNSILVAAGHAVVWTPSGGQATAAPTVPTAPTTGQTTPTTTEQATAAVNVGYIIQAPDQGRRGEDLTIRFQGEPNTLYTLSVVSAAGNVLTAGGLGETTSNADGVASWTWRVGSNTGAGTQRATVTGGGKTVNHSIVIIVD